MTELSPGPWLYEEDGCVGARGNVSDAHGHIMADIWSDHADGRAMASAHEALAVLRELAKGEEELQARREACTTCARPEDLLRAWLSDMRARAKAALEKAGVK